MRITKVEAQNLKGRSFAYDLGPAVAIIGDNFTGKSSVIDAIRLALIGYIPELGKTNAATCQLASSEQMNVRVTFEDNAVMTLSADKGKIFRPSAIADIPLLNASAYFAMTERERYDYVFGIAKMPEEFTVNAIIAELQRISFEEGHTEAIEEAKREIISALPKVGLTAGIEFYNVQEWLASRVDLLKSMFTQWNARVKDTVGAVRVLTELKNKRESMPGNTRQLAEAEKDARTAAENAYKAAVALSTRKKDAGALAQRKGRLENLRIAADVSGEIQKLERNIEEARGMIKDVVAVDEKILDDLKVTAAKMMGMLPQVGSRKQVAEKAQRDLAGQDKCPYCMSAGKNWKSRLNKTLGEEIHKLEHEYAEGSAILSGLRSEIEAGEKKVAAMREIRLRNDELRVKIHFWSDQVESLTKKGADWQKQVAQEEKEVADLGDIIVAPTEEELKAADEALAARKDALAKASDRLREAELLEHDIARAAQAQQEHEKAKAMVAVIKRVGAVLQEKKGMLVDVVFSDLLNVANSICGDILTSPLAFHEGEIGRWNGHRWISHKTFSGTEQALTFVAVATALSQGSPIRLLIFDELGRLDEGRRILVIGLLYNALENGLIDQFIVAGAVTHPWTPGGTEGYIPIPLQIIDLNEQAPDYPASFSTMDGK